VVAGFHCRLEILPGLEFLSCCQHSEGEKSPLHHEKDCTDDGCASIEFGFYNLETLQVTPAMPALALVDWASALPEREPASSFDHVLLNNSSASLPELPRIWRFSQRTALPPRAPSFVDSSPRRCSTVSVCT
jgi:hypothetical protein